MVHQFAPTDDLLRVHSLRSPLGGAPLLRHQAHGQRFRAYALDAGVEIVSHGEEVGILATVLGCIGVEEGEPFEVAIHNPSRTRIGVKLSLDGTDYLTGKPADLARGPMLVVDPYSSSSVRAWREGEAGGAAFLFTTQGKSVATHTHGDLRAAMTISLAVWVESEAVREAHSILRSMPMRGGYEEVTGALESLDSAEEASPMRSLGATKPMGIGAGAFTEQRFTEAEPFRRPVLRNLVTLRYMQASDLEWECRARGLLPSPSSSVVGAGFPGASPRLPFSDLGGTPRQGPPMPAVRAFNRFA